MLLQNKIYKDKDFGVPHTFLLTAEHERIYDKWIHHKRLTKNEQAQLREVKQRKVNELKVYESLKKR